MIEKIDKQKNILEKLLKDVNLYIENYNSIHEKERKIYDNFKDINIEKNKNVFLKGLNLCNEEFDIIQEIRFDLKEKIEFEIRLCDFIKSKYILDLKNELKRIDNEEYEFLLKKYKIKVHPATLGYIRKHLINLNFRCYTRNTNYISHKVFELNEKLVDVLEKEYNFITSNEVNNIIKKHKEKEKEYISFIKKFI